MIAVLSWLALLAAYTVGLTYWFKFCNYVLDKVWPASVPPSPLPITHAEIRRIPGLSTPRPWADGAIKGFEHRRTVVDLAERRRNRQVH